MPRRKLPLSKVYAVLESGPVVLVTTARRGRPNVMALSWLTLMDFEPPLIGLVMSDRNHSFAALKATRECVINVPTAEIADRALGCGNTSGAKVNKFRKFGLTPLPAAQVQAPLIRECPVNIECRVTDMRMVRRYDLFVLQAVAAWKVSGSGDLTTLHHLGGDRFMVAGPTVRLRSKAK
ncbi:MAG: flavin reductase family protein [Kiritimatiellae bacterium]|nr:flavin reductase family protein [Kiritimatiellia bacterium]